MAEIKLMEEAAAVGLKAIEDFFRDQAGAKILKESEDDVDFTARLHKYVSFKVLAKTQRSGIDMVISQF